MHLDWRHLFDWSVVSVTEPVPVKSKHGALRGYAIDVQYVYHGKRQFYFDMDVDLWYAQYGSPLEAARSFYKSYNAKAMEWQRKVAELCGVKRQKNR